MRNYYLLFERSRFRFHYGKEVIEKVIKGEIFAKEPGLELSGGIGYYLCFVLIDEKRFGKENTT